MITNISEFDDLLIPSFITIVIFVLFYSFYNKISIFFPEESIQEVNNKDSDSRSACSELSSKSEEKRRNKITKLFTKINAKMPEKILELKNKLIDQIYGKKKENNKFIESISKMKEDLQLIDKVNHNKGNVSFNENEEFMFFD
jgi:hypothetical protein